MHVLYSYFVHTLVPNLNNLAQNLNSSMEQVNSGCMKDYKTLQDAQDLMGSWMMDWIKAWKMGCSKLMDSKIRSD